MFGFVIRGFAVTASFRIPESHTFQQTLPLPPVTTLTGLMGAAMGLDFQAAMAFREKYGILFGICGTGRGEMKDLWKYNKVKHGESLKDVLVREYLTDFSLFLAVGSENQTALLQINDCFRDPKYALTLGTSDDLMKIKDISSVAWVEEEQTLEFENLVLAGDQTSDYESTLDLRNTPITYRVRAPQVFLLPTAFSFEGEERRVTQRKHFTFVGSPIRLKQPIPAHRIDGGLFSLL